MRRRVAQTGKPLELGVAYEVAFSADGRRLASTGRDVAVWDQEGREEVWRARPIPDPAHLAFSRDGKRLAVKSTAGEIVVLEAKTGLVVAEFENSSDGEGSNVVFSGDGKSIIDGSWEGVLRVRRADTGEVEFAREFPGDRPFHPRARGRDHPLLAMARPRGGWRIPVHRGRVHALLATEGGRPRAHPRTDA